MKNVLRSAFDPVPRPLSPGTQLLVVGVLVVGIAISLVEYLETSKPAPLAQEPSRDAAQLEVRTGSRTPTEHANRPRGLVRANVRGVTPAATSSDSTPGQPVPGIGIEPSSAGAAPMTLQPDGDG